MHRASLPNETEFMRYDCVYNASKLSAPAISKYHPPRKGQNVAAIISTGATRGVFGLSTAPHISGAAGHKLRLTASRWNFRLEVTAHASLCSFEILGLKF